jgi:rhodanese-related sulfurtransferase
MKMKILVTIMLIFSAMVAVNAQSKKDVNSKEVNSMLQKDKKLVVLDVRTPEEFNAGHIKGAINIDIRQPDALSKIDKLDRNAKFIVHCRTNHRSKIAVDHMLQSGFKTIYQMMDGMNGWNENKLPVVSK